MANNVEIKEQGKMKLFGGARGGRTWRSRFGANLSLSPRWSTIRSSTDFMGPIAQRSEQQTHNLLVAGSNPAGLTRVSITSGKMALVLDRFHRPAAKEENTVCAEDYRLVV